MKTTVTFSEWAFSFLFLSLLVAVVVIAEKSRYPFEILTSQEKIAVTITGAVSKPGTFWVYAGEPLEDVIKKSSPKRIANLRFLKTKPSVEETLSIHVEPLTEIEILVKGRVREEKKLILPVDTRVSQLKKKIELLPEEDSRVFKSRRFLRDGEVFEVPLA